MRKEKLPKNIIAFECGVYGGSDLIAVHIVNTTTKKGRFLSDKYDIKLLRLTVTMLLEGGGWSIEEGDLGKQIVF